MDIANMSLDQLIATQNDEPPLCEHFGWNDDYVVDDFRKIESSDIFNKIYNSIEKIGRSSNPFFGEKKINIEAINEFLTKELLGYTFDEISTEKKITKTRVGQIHKRQVRHIRCFHIQKFNEIYYK